MKFDFELYKKMLEKDRKVTQQMIENGQLSEIEGAFRDDMRKDEILNEFDDWKGENENG